MLKKARKIQLNLEKTKLNTEVFKVGLKVRESICIHILDDSTFMKIQPLNKYSKDVKGNMATKGLIVYSRLNYCKVKITECSGTENLIK